MPFGAGYFLTPAALLVPLAGVSAPRVTVPLQCAAEVRVHAVLSRIIKAPVALGAQNESA